MTATLTPTDQVRPPVPPPGAAPRSRREWVAFGALLLGTAALYLVNLSANGFANDFYAAAVQSMTRNWEAFFFGSFDAGTIVTVDKPPAALWVMALSARIFGFSSWSMLVPQALMAVGTVALLYAAVRRVSGPGAALVAGAAMALTPVAVLMFRFNNPDALLVLLMVAAAYAVVRAIEHAGTRWLLLAGALMGLAFLTKTAQALLVLPALTLAYGWAAPTGLWRRIRQLLAAGVAMVVVGGWWFVAVALWPAGSRPYIGGSTDNSAIQLALGYNGLGRILGEGGRGRGFDMLTGDAPAGFAGGPGPGGGGNPFGGRAGLGRLFAADVGGQIAWLLPAALVLLVIGLVLTARFARTDRLRASLLLWGGWTVVTALVFSLMQGIFHQYYTVALAPGIAALVGIGGAQLWERRDRLVARGGLAALVVLTAGWAWVLLDRTPEFAPWVRWSVLALGAVAAVALLLPRRTGVIAAVALVATLVSGLLGPAAYAAQTVATAKTGSIPLAGPSTGNGFGGFRGPGGQRGDRADRDRGTTGSTTQGGRTAADGTAAGGPGQAGAGGPGAGVFGGGGQSADPALVSLLQAAGTKWSAATVGSMAAAPLALSSTTDVMAIGGFSGSDPAPTLAAFQSYVAAGQVHYFISGDAPGGGPGGGRGGSTISAWVQQHFTATTVGGRTVYDLTKPASAAD